MRRAPLQAYYRLLLLSLFLIGALIQPPLESKLFVPLQILEQWIQIAIKENPFQI